MWTVIVVLAVAPLLLVPVALVWYLAIGGMHAAIREARGCGTTSAAARAA